MSRSIQGCLPIIAGGVITALLAGQHVAAAAAAPASADAPASTSEADTLRWIAARTSIAHGMILMVEPKAVVALAAKPPPPLGAVVRVELHEELTSAEAATRSARFVVDLDCSTHRYRIVERRMFPLPDLKGEPQTDPTARPWAVVDDGSPVARAWQASCTAGFVYPYASLAAAAAAPTPRAPPPPRPLAAKPAKSIARAVPPSAPAAPTPTPMPTPALVAPAPAGPYIALLGSFSVKANALAASDKLDHALAAQLAGRRKMLTAATIKGTSYTVLTVSGFRDAAEAGAFCTAARGIGLECLARRSAG